MASRRQAALDAIDRASVGSDNDWVRAGNIGTGKELAESVLRQPRDLLFSTERGLQNVVQNIDACFAGYRADLKFNYHVDIDAIERETGQKINDPKTFNDAIQQLSKSHVGSVGKGQEHDTAQKQIDTIREEITKLEGQRARSRCPR